MVLLNWMGDHPWMTFFAALFVFAFLHHVVDAIKSHRK